MIRTLLLVASLSTLANCGGNAADGRESPGDKKEWSILQSVELQTRNQKGQGVQFREIDGYSLAGVSGDDNSQLIWIMLNPSSPPFYKQMPEGNFWLSRDELLEIARKPETTSTVEEALRGHVRSR